VPINTTKNAVVGWLVLKSGKRVAKLYIRDVTPSRRTGGAIAGAAGAVAGLLVVWRLKHGGPDEEPVLD
jgi:hypothetical protein